MKKVEMTGRTFDRLTVEREAGRDNFGRVKWACRCVCGNKCTVCGFNLRSRHTTSCGCAVADAITTHGLHGTPAYKVWEGMIARCTNPSHRNWPDYGGRGISVCAQWRTFEGFYRDVGPRPAGLSIDRIDNDGNYEPGNVRWATLEQQIMNRRTTRRMQDGRAAKYVAEANGIAYGTLSARIRRGWSIDRAATEPV
jgi:hypothetical protein